MEKKGIWVPQFILEDKRLDWMNKILYAEIISLSKLEKGCIASNQHFATLLGLKNSLSAMNRIHLLNDLGYVTISRGNQHGKTQRRLYPKKFSLEDTLESIGGYTPEHTHHILPSIPTLCSTAYPAYTHEHTHPILTSIPNNTPINSLIKSSTNSVISSVNNTEIFDYTDKEAQNIINPEILKKFGI